MIFACELLVSSLDSPLKEKGESGIKMYLYTLLVQNLELPMRLEDCTLTACPFSSREKWKINLPLSHLQDYIQYNIKTYYK